MLDSAVSAENVAKGNLQAIGSSGSVGSGCGGRLRDQWMRQLWVLRVRSRRRTRRRARARGARAASFCRRVCRGATCLDNVYRGPCNHVGRHSFHDGSTHSFHPHELLEPKRLRIWLSLGLSLMVLLRLSLSLSFSWLLTGGRSDNSKNARIKPTLPDAIRYQPQTADNNRLHPITFR